VPVPGFERRQLGVGSEAEPSLHTESAFDRCSPDLLGLLCLRNSQAVPTLVASLADLDVSDRNLAVLFEPTAITDVDGGGDEGEERFPILYGER
jgi:hypothetical protein